MWQDFMLLNYVILLCAKNTQKRTQIYMPTPEKSETNLSNKLF